MTYRLVIVESPYRATTRRMAKRNVDYMLAAVRDSIRRSEAPFLSHLMYTGALDDAVVVERQLGIELGYAWWKNADAVCFYCDLGWSAGMLAAKWRATQHGMTIEERYIAKDSNDQFKPEQPEP